MKNILVIIMLYLISKYIGNNNVISNMKNILVIIMLYLI